ncbi:MAG: hypothetical protein ACP5RY_05810, partial [Thermoplasmata archaeon]
FSNQQCHIENGILRFPKIMNLEVKTKLKNVDLREVRIIPQGIGLYPRSLSIPEFTGMITSKGGC